MKLAQVAVQLYTLRAQMKTPRDIVAGLRKVRGIGYTAVEVSGIGEMPAPDLAAALRDEGLACCATHEPGEALLDRPASVVERLQTLGCRHTAYAYPAGVRLDTASDVKAFASRLDAAGRVLREAGITFCYHNHHLEFRRVAGRTVIEALYAETNPRHVQAELDTYWVQVGGGDPAAWCARLKDRLPLLHLKDYAINEKHEPVFAEVGAGNLDWPGILKSAEASGCRWFIVEQDACPGDPFDSIRASFAYLKEHLCSD